MVCIAFHQLAESYLDSGLTKKVKENPIVKAMIKIVKSNNRKKIAWFARCISMHNCLTESYVILYWNYWIIIL